MNREIATIDNQLKQSLDMFNTGNFLALGEYDDENLNDDVLLPELINKQPCCGTSASSGVIDLTKTPSDLVSDMKNKPVVKPIASNDDSGMSTNPSAVGVKNQEEKQVLLKQKLRLLPSMQQENTLCSN